MQTVRVSWKAVERAAAGHPWLFASDVTDRGDAQPGDAVRVVDPKGRAIGVAHYSSTSQITLRLLDRGAADIDATFFQRRIEAAAAFRGRVVRDSDAYRLVYSEADLMPGLIVDKYGDYFVVQTLTQGMERAQPEIVAALTALFHPAGILARNDATIRKKEDLPLETKVLAGGIPPRVALRMNGLAWHANLTGGQKTGIFLDQRENYVAARRIIRSHSQGRALDCFTSTGGFALHIAPACERVEAVDSSAEALATAEANRAANNITNVEFRQADAFEILAGFTAGKRTFDTVILDPPAFAKSRQNVTTALEAYKEINLRALRLLSSGGVLVTCSCSHHVSEAALLGVVAEAANISGRTLRVLERRTQAADHPILLTVPESHYLKCLIFELV